MISTLTSLFVSFTITPTLAGLWALRSHWKPWSVVERFGERFDDLRSWYTDRALPWSLGHGRLVAVFCGGDLRCWRWRWSALGRWSAKSSFRRSIAANSTSSSSIRSARRSNGEKGHLRPGEKVLHTADTFANTAVAGAYAASFGGFVSQSNVGQVHIWLKDERKHSTDYWRRAFR